MTFTTPDAHPFHASTSKQFGFVLQLLDEQQKALTDALKRVDELEAAIAAGSQGSAAKAVTQEPQPQLPAVAQDYCRITYGMDKFPKNTQAAILKHSAALAGLPTSETLDTHLDQIEFGKGFGRQDLMARWVVGEAEANALAYFLNKRGDIDFISREWRRVAK